MALYTPPPPTHSHKLTKSSDTKYQVPSHDNPFDVPDNISRQTLQNVGFAWEHEYMYQLWAPDSLSSRSDCCRNK